MMKKHFSTLFVLLLFAGAGFGQKFFKGSIKMDDGTLKSGLVEIPDSPSTEKVGFKKTANADKEEVDIQQVQSLTVVSETQETYVFDCFQLPGFKNKLSKEKYIVLQVLEGYADLYITGSHYKADKQGNIQTRDAYVVGADLPTFNYYIKKKDSETVDFLGMTSPSPTMLGLNKILKKQAAALLSDDEDLLKRINAGEFKHADIPEVVSIYNANKAKAKK